MAALGGEPAWDHGRGASGQHRRVLMSGLPKVSPGSDLMEATDEEGVEKEKILICIRPPVYEVAKAKELLDQIRKRSRRHP